LRYVQAVPVAVPIVAGTAIRGLAAHFIMRPVLERHPNAFLITLANFGVTMPMSRSQEHLHKDIQRGLLAQGHEPDAPVVLVGHSQGALACLRYAIDHPEQVLHTISVGVPWRGSLTAARLSRTVNWTGLNLAPALADMAEGSSFLTALHQDLPQIAERVTNIYSTHELFIRPYVDAHIAVPGVQNLLIASESEYHQHLRGFPDLPVDDLILGRITHVGEMNSPEVRSFIWNRVDEVGAMHGG
jgi:pimeloyl-ACP methyl ester carboxylesterase